MYVSVASGPGQSTHGAFSLASGRTCPAKQSHYLKNLGQKKVPSAGPCYKWVRHPGAQRGAASAQWWRAVEDMLEWFCCNGPATVSTMSPTMDLTLVSPHSSHQ
jgi:hypothetical protein